MQAAQIMADYSLGGADLLRRAMGKKIREMEAQRATFVGGAVEERHRRAQANFVFDLMEKFSGYGFNKVALRALCAGRLPDRLSKGELPGRVSRRVDDARNGQYRQAQPVPRRARPAGHRALAARHQPFRCRVRRRARPEDRRAGDPLCAGRGERGGGAGDARPRRRARRQRAVQGFVRFRPAARCPELQPAAVRKPGQGRRLRSPRPEPGADAGGDRLLLRQASRAAEERESGRRACSAASTAASPSGRNCRWSRIGRRSRSCSTSSTRSASTCRATRSTRTARAWNGPASCDSPICRRAGGQRSRASGSPASSSARRSAPRRAATASRSSSCRTPAGVV